MKESPIIFSTPMVQAILQGRKTQTRRIFKDHPRLASDVSKVDLKKWLGAYPDYILGFCPYGKKGDLIWVRETFAKHSDITIHKAQMFDTSNWYEVGGERIPYDTLKWKPSIHMPKKYARIWLRVIDVRVEWLQDISEEDASQEGVDLHERGRFWLNYLDQRANITQFIYNLQTAKESFQSLWSLIHDGRDHRRNNSWNSNPWVWVVEFEVVSTSGKENII